MSNAIKQAAKAVLVVSCVVLMEVDSMAASDVIEEIIVTARKREESLQEVPISANAFDHDQLARANITGIDEISSLTPGLFFQFFDDTRPNTFIRGVGSRQFDAGSEGSVGFFFDEFYLGRFSGQMTSLFDVKRVEVLKGPQGTFYGRNTIGGTINIISQDPTDVPSGYIDAQIGNLDQIRLEGAVSGPISGDRLTGRLSFLSNKRDGHITNLTTGTELQGEDTLAVRGKLLFHASDDLVLTLTAEVNQSERPGTQGEPIVGVFSARPGIQLETTPNRRDDFFNEDSSFDRDIVTLISKIEWDTGPFMVTSITGYRNSDLKEFRDLDSTRFDTIGQDTVEDSDSFSQELRFSSLPGGGLTFGDKVEWVVGLYYYNEDTDRIDQFPFGTDSAISSIIRTFDEIGIPAPILPGVDIFSEDFINNVETESVAVFGEATWALTDRLNLTAGLRWTRDEKEASISGVTTRPGLPPIFGNFTVDLNPDWTSTDPKISIDYRLSDDILAYAIYSEGFKSGGFQFAAFNPAAAGVVFDPEELTTYEVGLKTTLWDGRAQLNVNGFVYEYEDQQLPRIVLLPNGSFGQVITNAAQSDITGAELDFTVTPVEGLLLRVGYAYLDAEYDKFIFNDTTDFSGNRMLRSPEHSYNLTFDYVWPVGQGEASVRFDWSWQDEIFFEFDEGATIGTEQSSFGLLSGEIGYGLNDWRLAVWGKNLTDKDYRNSVLNFGGNTIEFLGLPRTYGIRVGYVFQ